MVMKLTMAYLKMTLLLITVASITTTTAYTNHTVGGRAGWFFNVTTNTSVTNYSDWVANQTFNLGDYLIFNTNTNQTVIQTYNLTTYRNCSIDYSSDNDTFSYNGGNNQFGQALTISVPLTIEGLNYYFSSATDGIQCQRGMAFQINVRHGVGLPPNLNQPPPPPYVEPPSPGEDAQSPPVTDLPAGGGMRTSADVSRVIFVLLCGVLVFIR